MRHGGRAAAPVGVWMALFTVIPLGIVLWFAFTDSTTGQFTFANILAIGDYAGTYLFSIWIGFLSTIICLLLAYPLAYGIARATDRVQQTLILLVMLPMWMNFLLRTYGMMTLMEDNGLINQLLRAVHLPALHMINTSGAVVAGMVYNFLPFMVLPLYSVMAKMDIRLLEAARDLGCSGRQTLWRVVLPLSVPGIVSGITMVFVPAVSTFVITQLLGGSLKLYIGDVIEQRFIGTASNFGVGSSLSLVLMVLVLLSMALMRLVDKGDDQTGGLYV